MNCEAAFQGIKDELVSAKVLIHYDPSLPLLLAIDASSIGMGAVLSHKMPDGIRSHLHLDRYLGARKLPPNSQGGYGGDLLKN
jgi:hypothetical protein